MTRPLSAPFLFRTSVKLARLEKKENLKKNEICQSCDTQTNKQLTSEAMRADCIIKWSNFATYSQSQTTNNTIANRKEFLNENNPRDMMFALLCVCSKPSATRIRFARTLFVTISKRKIKRNYLHRWEYKYKCMKIQIQINKQNIAKKQSQVCICLWV